MSIYDKPYTWTELIEEAQQYNKNQIPLLAMHLCRAVSLNPDDNAIGPFLCGKLCQNNVEGVTLWVKEYLTKEDLLPAEAEQNECERAFRFSLHRRVPSELLVGLD